MQDDWPTGTSAWKRRQDPGRAMGTAGPEMRIIPDWNIMKQNRIFFCFF
jgi:hypothetical protein